MDIQDSYLFPTMRKSDDPNYRLYWENWLEKVQREEGVQKHSYFQEDEFDPGSDTQHCAVDMDADGLLNVRDMIAIRNIALSSDDYEPPPEQSSQCVKSPWEISFEKVKEEGNIFIKTLYKLLHILILRVASNLLL